MCKNQNSTILTWCMTRRRSSRGRAAASWATSSTHSPSSPVSPLSSSCPHHRGKHPSHLGWLLILHPRLLKFDSFLYDVIHWDGWRCCVPLQLKNAGDNSEDKKKRRSRSWEGHVCIVFSCFKSRRGRCRGWTTQGNCYWCCVLLGQQVVLKLFCRKRRQREDVPGDTPFHQNKTFKHSKKSAEKDVGLLDFFISCT